MGCLLTMIAGFALACTTMFNPILFLQTLVGLGLVIASACVINNYIDKHTDQKMQRTKHRALATELISGKSAILFAITLGIVGVIMLAFFANYLAAGLSIVGFIVYVSMYSLLKKHTSYATLIGSISGAVPPVVGYVAVSNRIDLGAFLLFAILVLWQMPHFYAIAIRYEKQYSAASIPVLPVSKGISKTKKHIVYYIIAFILTVPLLTMYGYANYWFLAIASALSGLWLWLSIKGFKRSDDTQWAKQMFLLSLVIIVAISGMMVVPKLMY